jgi:hypothetical protein
MCIEKQQNALHYIGVFLLRYFYLHENWILLGFYAASGGNFLPTFRDNLSVPSSGLKNQESCGILKPEDRTNMLSGNIVKKITTTRSVITQKSSVLIYFAAGT